MNLVANFLGLGNAATPLGIKAVKLMRTGDTASDDLCMFVVLNSASIQLIPATIAGLRASLGSSSPFDILPAVWLASVLTVSAGIISAKIFERFSA
jgi:spore maturation protein A